MASFFAFLHHVAAFTLVSAVVLEWYLLREELTLKTARALQRIDGLLGASAGLLLVIGLLRVSNFEKGAGYYFHSAPFIAKLSLFVAVALLSIYPTVVFIKWGKAAREGKAPAPASGQLRAVRTLVHLELAGIVLILLFAALMAKGIGFLG
jgi:putative membrane protein